MTHETSLRAIRRQDWRYLARLSLSAFPDATSDQVSETLRDVSNVVVLDVDGKPAGYAAFRHERQGVLWCDWVAVDAQYRNLGYGAMLIKAVESLAGHRGYDIVMLAVLKANVGAIKFYLGLGYEHAGEDNRKFHLKKGVSRPVDIVPAIPSAPRSRLYQMWDRLLFGLLVN